MKAKKDKTLWQCSKCEFVSPKWAGQCANCGGWNCLAEKIESPQTSRAAPAGNAKQTLKAAEFVTLENVRIPSGLAESDRVLGGGFFPDSICLLAGAPGVGKSTLALQWCQHICESGKKVLIASGEESCQQIFGRAERIFPGKVSGNLEVLNEFSIEDLLATCQSVKPDFLVVDSVQTFASGESTSQSGSRNQISLVCESLMHFAKTRKIPVLLIGHVTKAGEMAGPQLLAHLVDCVLLLEGDEARQFRILRSSKNRFGSASEVGIFQMQECGLQQVLNPSEAFLDGRLAGATGSCIFPAVEGERAFLVELQALCATTRFGLPKRVAGGIAPNRLALILAVLQNHARLNFENVDAFANVVGGFQIQEPAADLALALALASAKQKKPVPGDVFAFGEIGLSGEIRAVGKVEKRIQEAAKLGFSKCLGPKLKHPPKNTKVKFVPVRTVAEAVSVFAG